MTGSIDATTTQSDIESELRFLREQNQQLQSQLEMLLISRGGNSDVSNEHDCATPPHPISSSISLPKQADNPNATAEKTGTEMTRTISDPTRLSSDMLPSSLWTASRRNSPPPPPPTLHHRRSCRKDDDISNSVEMSPSVRSAKSVESYSSSGRSMVKSKVSDMDHVVPNGEHSNSMQSNSSDEEVSDDDDGDCELVGISDGNDEKRSFLREKKTKHTRDGGGNYSQALFTEEEAFDEEECRVLSNLHMSDDDGNDSDDIIDDDSHNKHQPPPKPPLCGGNRPRSRSAPNIASTTSFPTFRDAIKDRAGWLIGLLFLQSCSSFIIQYNEGFLQDHMVIVQFLTMLVGAGGNAGNQASVRVIRELALGTLNERTMKPFLKQEAKMAFGLSGLLGLTGFIRAALFRTPPGETIAVTASLCAIVAISVGIGSTLPLVMKKVGIDPAHSSTTIQVLMDIFGVLITVSVSSLVFSFKMFMHKGSGDDVNDENSS
mmetsp:Transcript_11484/g.22914  ORF Transcript_11484/g.22914 Transcript_11484/m.22914 type:complete len:489 (+) Transcript_11484:49-1515(+)